MGEYLPYLNEIETERSVITAFGGYNHNLRIADNEFTEMTNMSSRHFPVLCPRERRGRVRRFTKANGIFAHNKLAWVDGLEFFYDGEKVCDVTDTYKQFVGMGAYILIWPDKIAFNTNTHEVFPLENTSETYTTVTTTLCMADGTPYEDVTTGSTPPENPSDGDLWLDTSAETHVLRQWSSVYGLWQAIATTFVKIAATDIGVGFKTDDGVTISGMDDDVLNGSFILNVVNDDYIVVTALIDETGTQDTPVTVKRTVPDMDFLTESENRVWGCSSANHEIYACAQGDPTNWNQFRNISTDSYAATIGSPGDFTGCCTFAGSVLFFKEDVLHKLFGNRPSNYQITNVNCRGVAAGSEKSLVINNETLYYKSVGGIMTMYQSSLPTSISDALGKDRYSDAVGGALDGKYYVSMRNDKTGKYELFVYDEDHAVWHREDNTKVSYFDSIGEEIYYLNDDDKTLYSAHGDLSRFGDSLIALEPPVEWSAQFADIGMDSPDSKYVSKIQLRMEVDEGAIMCIDVKYDHEDTWKEVFRINPNRKRSFTIPIIPQRCDNMQIRLRGIGDTRVYSVAKTIEQGGEA